MVKTIVTNQGVISVPGSGFEGTPSALPSATRTSSATLTNGDAGLTIMSASAGVLTMTMPAVSACAGAMFVFRSTSPSAHIITGSSASGNVFATRYGNPAGNVTGSHGDSVTFPAIANSSVVMLSDGSNWLIIGGSGSMTIAAGAVGP